MQRIDLLKRLIDTLPQSVADQFSVILAEAYAAGGQWQTAAAQLKPLLTRDPDHIDRGYSDLVEQLQAVGADVTRVRD